ncbi:MAG: sigma-70 family RNA polymerase sigma factor [Phycisphaerae bacterium]|nr:sigma-70 family RNA polymerase sigma factor [Saprospiraceae bacterium]
MENKDLTYIRAILNNDSTLLDEIYRRFLPPLFGMLRRNGGRFEDAKDVFQEAIVVVFHHAARPGFQLTAPFQSYLIGIGRFIWLRQLKKNARIEVTSDREDGFDVDADLEHQIFESEKQRLFREKFTLLGKDCQQLLQRFFDREPLNRIANDMGYTDDYVKKKNKVCKGKLMELIQKDTRYGELTSHIYSAKTQAAPNGE